MEQAKGRKKRRREKQHHEKRSWSERLTSVGYLLPSVAGVLVFFVLPFLVVIAYAFTNNSVQMDFVGFDNFKSVLSNSAFRLAAKNTAIFSAMAVPLAVVLALLLAVLLDAKIPGKSQFRTIFLSPMMVPVASIVLLWQVLFHYNGAVNEFLSFFGVEKIDWLKSDYNRYVVLLLFLWKNLGYNMILFLAALSNVPTELVEMATLEGAGSIRTFFTIKLRYISPTVLFVTILSLINSFKIFREVYLLTGNYPYDGLYLLQHYMNNMFRNLDYQKLSTAALLMAAVMAVVIGLLFLVENRYGKDIDEE